MKTMIRGLGVASLLALGSAGLAQADPMTMMQGYAACSTEYSSCLAAADYALASSPSEGMSKMQMNAQHAQQCFAAWQACASAVR
ncbi:MAG: hypothetical protein BroJett030_02440 [Alphaproteobacteria bacterium]|nr:MAG: hypothetical protein BroJett030_02440 [Alphaproteobacteria bacterium]